MANPSDISNNDLVLLRKVSKKYTKITLSTSNKKFQIEGTSVSILSTSEGLSFISVPATNAIYKNGALVSDPGEVKAAIKVLKEAGRSSSGGSKRKSSQPELPEDLRKQLEAFSKQNNSRVIFDPSSPSGYKVQKLRTRKTKK